MRLIVFSRFNTAPPFMYCLLLKNIRYVILIKISRFFVTGKCEQSVIRDLSRSGVIGYSHIP